MPSSRTERRLDATKEKILGTLDDEGMSSGATKTKAFLLSDDLNGCNRQQIELLVEDLKQQLSQQIHVLMTESEKGKQEQTQVYFSNMLKLPKNVKKMTIRDFDAAHKCNLLGMITLTSSTVATAAAAKKRVRPATITDLETPAPVRRPHDHRLLTTPMRTVKKGEAIYSKNGSPVDTVEEGTLVATVSKKRRGNSTMLKIGEGRYVDLEDPDSMKDLSADIKGSAISQIMILQEHMQKCLAQLNN